MTPVNDPRRTGVTCVSVPLPPAAPDGSRTPSMALGKPRGLAAGERERGGSGLKSVAPGVTVYAFLTTPAFASFGRTDMRILAALASIAPVVCAGAAIPLAQPERIPGTIAITAQPFPAAAAVIGAPASDRPVYGLYIWKAEYLQLRDEIRKVGWRQFRFGGPWDDEIMRLLVGDDVEVMWTIGPRKGQLRPDFPTDDAFIAAYVATVEGFSRGTARAAPFSPRTRDCPTVR